MQCAETRYGDLWDNSHDRFPRVKTVFCYSHGLGWMRGAPGPWSHERFLTPTQMTTAPLPLQLPLGSIVGSSWRLGFWDSAWLCFSQEAMQSGCRNGYAKSDNGWLRPFMSEYTFPSQLKWVKPPVDGPRILRETSCMMGYFFQLLVMGS